MIRRGAMAVLATTMLTFGSLGAAEAAYPERPLTLIVPWGAGGGTDATARIVASELEKGLGVPVNVVNRTGGSGVVGHSAIATAAPDGYTIGIITVEIGMMHWQGLTELKGSDYTPLALMNEDPPGINVPVDAKWNTLEELITDIKAAQPGELKASGTGQGGIWHVALGGMLQAAGVPANHVQWIPSQGAAPGLQDMLSGGVQLVPCSVPEAKALIDAGRVKSLAIMAEQRNPVFPDVPTVKESIGIDFSVGAWRGFAGPPGMDQEAVAKLEPLMKKIFDSAAFKDFMNNRGFGMVYLPAAEFGTFMEERDAMFGKIMTDLGLAKAG
ncbi:MAG TPA: tripartite tricarboxylate transporter substrate binding protein [Geminicoccus sp.]|jgi:tripartite-type tricarboxylate transporter receptor subunit TctC|uniref:tripartite tricarboxylate transporter substrate binding protein n=1 Tax=Geminicoccus sp. TaxID=2024832 RepID=UPI002E335BA0|nr:tripartite tricarboxylate transporter substrate binding protein [Geminicoccus sp.]HEX2524932.1 tripartite tricarboxylate transporter substrate binding protein [Geminicoccus sp.]